MTPESRLDRIELKLEVITEGIHSIDKTLVAQHSSLTEHMRRTELAEEAIQIIREDIQPVKAHIHRIDGVLKFVGISSVVVSIAAGLLKIFQII